MIVTILALIAGACIGILAGYASVPRDRMVVRIAGGFLTFLAATTVLVVEPGSYVAAVVVALTTIGSFIVCAAILWRRLFGKIESFGWFLTKQVLRPQYLAKRYEHTDVRDGSPSSTQ